MRWRKITSGELARHKHELAQFKHSRKEWQKTCRENEAARPKGKSIFDITNERMRPPAGELIIAQAEMEGE